MKNSKIKKAEGGVLSKKKYSQASVNEAMGALTSAKPPKINSDEYTYYVEIRKNATPEQKGLAIESLKKSPEEITKKAKGGKVSSRGAALRGFGKEIK